MGHRRTAWTVLALVALASGGCKSTASNSASANQDIAAKPAAAAFVKRQGAKLTLGGKPFLFTGSNFYRLALADAFGAHVDKQQKDGTTIYPQIDAVISNYASEGIRVVRLWGFACEASRGTNVQPPLRHADLSLDAAAMQQLDYTMAAAGKAGLKIILPLVNFEPEYCGMEWWVEHTLGTAGPEDIKRMTYECTNSGHAVSRITFNPDDCKSSGEVARATKELFYTDPLVKAAYKDQTQRFLQRVNPYTGVSYIDDPTIMAIELANEPHTVDYYECMVSAIGTKTVNQCRSEGNGRYKPGYIVHDWLGEMSAFLKGIDKNHLISTGEEGYRASHQDHTCLDRGTWIHDGSKGVDFGLNVTIPTVDIMTTHLYPDNWAIPAGDLEWFNRCIIQDRGQLAAAAGKPIIMEESGFSEVAYPGKADDYRADRGYFISRMFRYATAAGFAGTMVWQAAPLTTGQAVAEKDTFTFPIKLPAPPGQLESKDGGAAFVYTAEGDAVRLGIACSKMLDDGAKPEDCIYACPAGTKVDAQRFGSDATAGGRRCFLSLGSNSGQGPGATNTAATPTPVSPTDSKVFPDCPAGSALQAGWGWITTASICNASPNTAQQFKDKGGCSCH